MGGEPTTAFPLSFQQAQVLPALLMGSPLRVICHAELRGPLDVVRLRDSIGTVVGGHEILRSTLQSDSVTPAQYVSELPDLRWSQEELTHFGSSERNARLRRWLDEQMALEAEWGQPPLHVLLACLGSGLHALLLSLPTYCADPASMDHLLGAIAAAYSGNPPGEEPLQYGDYVLWQQEMFSAPDTLTGRKFWANYLKALQPQKWGRAWPSIVRPDAGDRNPHYRVDLEPSQITGLASVASSFDVELPVVLLAIWHILLTRISQFQTQLIGFGCDGRDYPEFRTAIGPLARRIPLQITSSPETKFTDLLAELRRSVGDIQGWQQSFSGLPESHETAIAPEIGFNYLEFSAGYDSQGMTFAPIAVQSGGQEYALCLSTRRQGTHYWLEFAFDPSLLNRQTVEEWGNSYLKLLQSAIADPRRPIVQLPLLDDRQRQRLLVEWNQTMADYPRGRCMQQLIEEQVERTPNRIAVRCMDRVLTYRELNEQSNQLAHWLRAHGVGRDQRVGLCIDRSLEMIVGIVGILKAGGAYVPLNAEHPPLRLAQQLEGAVALVTEGASLTRTAPFAGAVVCLDRDCDTLRALPNTNPAVETNPENLVYVLFTSGSTGVPKGVAVRHRNLVNYTWFARTMLEIEKYPEGLQFSLVSTVCADVGITCIYPALTSGGCLHVIPYDVAADSARYAEYSGAAQIDVLKIVPSHLLALLSAGGGRAVLPKKFVVVGGERLTRELMDKITAENVGCEIVNHYAPSETTCGSLTLRLSTFDWKHWQGASIPLGRPIANTHLYVLDAQQEPVPIGAIGELYISGDGVSSGYVSDPKRTQERFLPDRFDPGRVMYRSGDVVRYVSDGNIEFLERVDDQVKIRGFRVELGEVQAALESHPQVKQAVVLARDSEHGKRLLAWAVGRDGLSLSGDELREHVKQRLPEYMVPAKFMVLARMPLTQNGKIDRQNLPEPDEAVPQTAPRTTLEQTVAEIWCEVLELDRVGVDQNFFEVGGHSLLATQVVARLRDRLSAPVPVRALFDHPTVERLAKELEKFAAGESNTVATTIKPVPRNRPLPLSFAQEAVWTHHQFEPNSSLYNIPRAWRLTGSLNVAAMQRTLNEIVRRHESLRTLIKLNEGRPAQTVSRSMYVPIANYDLSSASALQREDTAREIVEQEASRPFDLERGPLLRANLIALSPEDHVLLLVFHHIVSDAWSAGIFFREFKVLYEAYVQGRDCALPELPIQFGDYAAHERALLQGKVLDAHLSHWRNELHNAPEVLALPTDRPRTGDRSFLGRNERVQLSAGILKSVKDLALSEATTPFTVLITAFKALLWSYSGQEQIVVGSDFANRSTPEVEALIGFFVNVLPLRTDFSGDPTFRDLLTRAQKSLMGAHTHQQLPLSKIVETLRPRRSSSYNPLVQVLFVYQNAPTTEKSLSGLKVESFDIPVTTSKFDLAVFVAETNGGLTGHWVYSADLFDRETVIAIAQRFEDLLAYVLPNPNVPLNSCRQLWPLLSVKPESGLASEAAIQTGAAFSLTASNQSNDNPQLNRTEQIVAEIWREMLGLDNVTAHDNLFEIGGHSLVATQIASRLRQRFGRAIYVRTLFDRPTIRGLAHLIDHDHDLLEESLNTISRAPRHPRKQAP